MNHDEKHFEPQKNVASPRAKPHPHRCHTLTVETHNGSSITPMAPKELGNHFGQQTCTYNGVPILYASSKICLSSKPPSSQFQASLVHRTFSVSSSAYLRILRLEIYLGVRPTDYCEIMWSHAYHVTPLLKVAHPERDRVPEM